MCFLFFQASRCFGFAEFADEADVSTVLVGNKTDLYDARAVSVLEASRFAQENDLAFLEASAASGDGVDEDDLVAFTCSLGFEPPPGVRIDEASENTIAQVLVAKAEILARAVEAHPDPAIQAVYGPLFRRDRDDIEQRMALGLAGVRIPYVKFPRKPDDK